MTYCVAMRLRAGLLFASDTRTNAGVDHIASFRKMHQFQIPHQREIVILNAGNLATTQSVISLLNQRLAGEGEHLLNVPSLYDAAVLVGRTLKEVVARDSANGGPQNQGVDFGANFLLGGQIKGEGPRLFHIYPAGNFIEATEDTPYFQIGESKYGKPIIDRVVSYEHTPLEEAAKCTLVSFDSTIRSNLSVGLPIDILMLRANQFEQAMKPPHRVERDDPYFLALRDGWSQGLKRVFDELPNEPWFAD
ncbi:MAG: peptidase [Roseateles depolymerans]|uniref:Peptidase n=1 Tax=Roseateles depolymerans TaxID=76731 RepID=A0A2W5FJ98_9BURK|nr:MAG: peptidase [Roseateles depolymerans]